ncbi:MAG: response regulator transcription factor [Chloroflexota bacterium]
MLDLLIVEDNERLRPALSTGLVATGEVNVLDGFPTGEEALEYCFQKTPNVVLMDVQLAGQMNGIEAAVAIRREHPRLPIVFYSIQDDEEYYRAFIRSGILSHYAYVRKSNYLLPNMIVPLLRDAAGGRSFIDPDIETRVHEVRQKDENDPMSLLEPNEQEVAKMVAAGMSNLHIAQRLGFRDKRTISRINGQIYTAWGLNATATDEKVARTRATIIVNTGRLLTWDEDGIAYTWDESGNQVLWEG